ncbi:hypothetical protein LZ30DRAFT_303569 [Colletotrichum cereale]|nr:hypothetical protein LZ30DRAFT_303569 [Colletotrichum cereale]
MAWRGLAWTRILRCSGRDQKKVVSGMAGQPAQAGQPHSLPCDACNTFPRSECGYGMRLLLGVDLDQTDQNHIRPSAAGPAAEWWVVVLTIWGLKFAHRLTAFDGHRVDITVYLVWYACIRRATMSRVIAEDKAGGVAQPPVFCCACVWAWGIPASDHGNRRREETCRRGGEVLGQVEANQKHVCAR